MVDWQPGHWPQVGVGVFIVRDGKVLFGNRIGSHGHGTWSLPGGKLERGETVEECAARETLEETGLTIRNVKKTGVFTDDRFSDEGKHFVTVYTIGEAMEGDPRVMEPDKLVKWHWADWDDLPQPLFLPIQHLLEQGYRPPGA